MEPKLAPEDLTSRFVVTTDPRAPRMLFDLPEVWWSRPYEYAWAAKFARPDDVVLDAACGICHPFKFYLTDRVKSVHAFDADPRILSAHGMLADMAETFGLEATLKFDTRYIERVFFEQGSLLEMPYPDAGFDTIFCVSVLEHLPPEAQVKTLVEFKRVLKPGGQLVMTFDHPLVDLQLVTQTALALGFTFAGPANFELPADALYSTMWNLRCIRTVFRREALPA